LKFSIKVLIFNLKTCYCLDNPRYASDIIIGGIKVCIAFNLVQEIGIKLLKIKLTFEKNSLNYQKKTWRNTFSYCSFFLGIKELYLPDSIGFVNDWNALKINLNRKGSLKRIKLERLNKLLTCSSFGILFKKSS